MVIQKISYYRVYLIYKKEKRFKAPSIKRDNISERKRVECGDAVKCIDGRCFDSSYESNNEMGEAVGALSTLKEMQDEGIECAKCPEDKPDCVPDPKSCRVFNGEVNKCVIVRGEWVSYAVAAAAIYIATAGVAAPSVFAEVGGGSVWSGVPTAGKLKFIAAQAAKLGLASLAKVDSLFSTLYHLLLESLHFGNLFGFLIVMFISFSIG